MEDKQDRFLSTTCLLTGALSYPLICIWYVGLPLAVISVGLWIYHRKRYESNRLVNIGGILGLIMVCVVLLFLLLFGLYFGLISGENDIDWATIIEDLDIY